MGQGRQSSRPASPQTTRFSSEAGGREVSGAAQPREYAWGRTGRGGGGGARTRLLGTRAGRDREAETGRAATTTRRFGRSRPSRGSLHNRRLGRTGRRRQTRRIRKRRPWSCGGGGGGGGGSPTHASRGWRIRRRQTETCGRTGESEGESVEGDLPRQHSTRPWGGAKAEMKWSRGGFRRRRRRRLLRLSRVLRATEEHGRRGASYSWGAEGEKVYQECCCVAVTTGYASEGTRPISPRHL